MSERRSMQLGDWLNAAVSVVIGALLGSAAYGLAQLVASGAWLMAAIIVLLGITLFLIMVIMDKISDRLFPSWIGTVGKRQKQLLKPLARVLSLPVGFLIGMVLAVLGFDRTLLDLLP